MKSPHSFLTALSPIEHRANDPEGRLSGLRNLLRTTTQIKSPFRRCPMAHMVRLQVIDTLRPAMGDTENPPLKSSYLLFVAELDGQIDDFLDCLYRVDPQFVGQVWGRCEGWPEYEGAVFLRRYINRCMVKDPLPFAAFPQTAPELLQSLARKDALGQFAADVARLDDAALQQAWRARRDSLVNAKPWIAGTP